MRKVILFLIQLVAIGYSQNKITYEVVKLDSQSLLVFNNKCENKFYNLNGNSNSLRPYINALNKMKHREISDFKANKDTLINISNQSSCNKPEEPHVTFVLIDSSSQTKKFRYQKILMNRYTIRVQFIDTFIILKNIYSSLTFNNIKKQFKIYKCTLQSYFMD